METDTLKKQIDKYKERLRHGATEYNKLVDELEKVKSELVEAKGKAQEVETLKAEKASLQDTLSQMRLQSKFKIKELKKQLDADKQSQIQSPSASQSTDLLDTPVHDGRISELESSNAQYRSEIEQLKSQLKELGAKAIERETVIKGRTSELNLLKEQWDSNQWQLALKEGLNAMLLYHDEPLMLEDASKEDTIIEFKRMIDKTLSIPKTAGDLGRVSVDSKRESSAEAADPAVIEIKWKDECEKLQQSLAKQQQEAQKLEALHARQLKEAEETVSEMQSEITSLNVQLDLLRGSAQANVSTDNDAQVAQLIDRIEVLELERQNLLDRAAKHDRTASEVMQTTTAYSDMQNSLLLEKERCTTLAKTLESVQVNHKKEIDELNSKLHAAEEQMADFKLQVASRQAEIASLKSNLSSSSTTADSSIKERDDKIKKLKGLLLAANKSMTESKKLIAEREATVSEMTERQAALTSSLESKEMRVSELEGAYANVDSVTELERKLREIESLSAGQISELEAQVSQLKAELENTKTEFQNYRSRANTLLQQSGSTMYESRIEELERNVSRLERENNALKDQLSASSSQLASLQRDLDESLDECSKLEVKLGKLQNAEQLLASLQQQLEVSNSQLERSGAEYEKRTYFNLVITNLKEKHETAVRTLAKETKEQIELLETQLKAKDEQMSLLNQSNTRLQDEMSKVQEQLTKSKIDLERLKNITRRSSAASIDGPTNSMLQSPILDTFKEKEYLLKIDQLQSIINENQAEIQRNFEQINLLKQECQKIDRVDKRQYVKLEFLKNIVLSFLESKSRLQLLPVVTQVLQLDKDETKRLKGAIESSEGAGSIFKSLGL